MAFIDFADAAHQVVPTAVTVTATVHTLPVAPATAAHPLSALELRIVGLARQDGLDSLRPQRKRGWLARLILGPTPPSAMLANEQLEALRRLAVRAWQHGYTLPVSALKEAQAAGYSMTQIGAVIDTINRTRAPFRRLAA